MIYDFAHTSVTDARAWFDLLISRINFRFNRKYYSRITDLPQNDQATVTQGMQDFMQNDIGTRVGVAAPSPVAAVPTLDEIARVVLALPHKDQHRLYQLLYNNGCRINR